MTVYGMSDALNSLGFEWSSVLKHIRPDQVSVYAGSALSQVDAHSMAGVVSQPLLGHRVNSKMLPLSLAEMPADFINSYIINSVGTTGHNVGACATFLYNLRLGVQDIQTGQAKVAIVGGAEAPVVPDIIEGFRVMSALATDEQLCGLDGVDKPNHRRACRPFSTNVGFTLGESAQFVVLMEEELAFELGAHVLGSIAGVYIHADGNKKSIASPGIGNYITMAKAASLTRSILGDEGLKQTYVQAHGTGTPQNRVTESHILNEIAKTYGIAKWQVSAVKSYLGHSIAVAAGDQLAAALGVWEHGYLPGIKTIDHIADDVSQSHLSILMDHAYVGEKGQQMRAALLNSKGFGGNNATAVVLSPQETRQLLDKRHSASRLKNYDEKCMKTKENILQNDQQTCDGKERIVYQFGEAVMDQKDVMLRQEALKLSQFENEILLSVENPY